MIINDAKNEMHELITLGTTRPVPSAHPYLQPFEQDLFNDVAEEAMRNADTCLGDGTHHRNFLLNHMYSISNRLSSAQFLQTFERRVVAAYANRMDPSKIHQR